MARFDVHRTRNAPSLLLDVQANELSHLPTRVVVPLVSPSSVLPAIRDLNPLVVVEEENWVVMVHYLTAMSRRELGRPIASLAAERDNITRALDLLLTGF